MGKASAHDAHATCSEAQAIDEKLNVAITISVSDQKSETGGVPS